jgi:hypothetical protein
MCALEVEELEVDSEGRLDAFYVGEEFWRCGHCARLDCMSTLVLVPGLPE